MLKNLNTTSFGLSCRQNEIIEFALTYKFDSFDLDIDSYLYQLKNHGIDHAKRFIASANIGIGTFELPVRWNSDVATYKSDLAELPTTIEAVRAIGATRCVTTVPAFTDDLPYHEKFEQLRERFAEIADLLQKSDMKLGLSFLGKVTLMRL